MLLEREWCAEGQLLLCGMLVAAQGGLEAAWLSSYGPVGLLGSLPGSYHALPSACFCCQLVWGRRILGQLPFSARHPLVLAVLKQ